MQEYANGGSSAQEQYFGYKLCSARNVIERSFGRLKAHFGALKRAMDACFIFYNVCELNHETIGEDQVQQAMQYDTTFQPPTASTSSTSHCNEVEGKRVRNVLTSYFDP